MSGNDCGAFYHPGTTRRRRSLLEILPGPREGQLSAAASVDRGDENKAAPCVMGRTLAHGLSPVLTTVLRGGAIILMFTGENT